MRNNVVKVKSYAFALRTIRLYKHLSFEKKEYILSKQILKSGTSIGANVEEADAAISKADFSARISIAYKEARETCYWLRLLLDSDYLDKKSFDSIFVDVEELCKLLFTILKSSGRIKQ
ncbi:MAG: four helix bundle protein [Marivirga sp.]|nr:four helix bundle protein [Marivirga sp.]